MGLDCSHDAWSGAYSSFMRWRMKLAEAAGYGDIYSRDAESPFWNEFPDESNVMGDWETTPDDPLKVLLNHSDCEGYIKPAQAKPLADRLEELIEKLPDESGGGHLGNYRDKTRAFIGGLRDAAEANENLEFF